MSKEVNLFSAFDRPINWDEIGKNFVKFFSIDWAYFWGALPESKGGFTAGVFYNCLITFAVTFISTVIAFFISIPVGILASHKLFGKKAYIAETFLIVIRTFPELLLGLFLVGLSGYTTFTAIFALSLHSIGMEESKPSPVASSVPAEKPLKLNYKRTFIIGFAFFGILMLWQIYNSFCSKFLTQMLASQKGLTYDQLDLPENADVLLDVQYLVGIIMACDNIAALFLLPIFGHLSDKTHTRWGKRMPYIIVGTVISAIAFPFIPILYQYNNLGGMIALMAIVIFFMYMSILDKARHFVYLSTPYLIIDAEMKDSLLSAAKRGVDVRILVPHIPDKKAVFHITRSFYGDLMKAGIKIYEYTPGFVHEIYDGTVIIKGIAREAGIRSKVAVTSNNEDVDATGACIGQAGSRIQKIVAQLGNGKDKEKIDVINYSTNPGLFICEALRPATVVGVALTDPTAVLSKEQLIVEVWGAESDACDNNVEAYISFLRKKLKFLGSRISIKNLQKLGYKLEVSCRAET